MLYPTIKALDKNINSNNNSNNNHHPRHHHQQKNKEFIVSTVSEATDIEKGVNAISIDALTSVPLSKYPFLIFSSSLTVF